MYKIKIIKTNDSTSFEEKIESFIKNKNIKDIKFQTFIYKNIYYYTAMIIYDNYIKENMS